MTHPFLIIMSNKNITLTMLALMVAALSFTACSDNEEDEDKGGGSLIIDGVAYYYEATISKSYYGGLYLNIDARESRVNFGPDKILKIYLYGHSKVSELKKGEYSCLKVFVVSFTY